MALSLIYGRNGSGKSLFAMHLLVEELLRSNRPIMTTLAVDCEALQAYMNRDFERGRGMLVDVHGRVRVLTEEELGFFWRHRGQDEFHKPIDRGPFGGSDWVHDGGCCFILDEVQMGFSARSWRERGPEFLQYQPQHRHFGDDVIAITPHPALVEKGFRILCGECVVLSNWYKLSFKGVKLPGRIVWRRYINCPPQPGEIPSETGKIFLDARGLAACYDTSAGVGVIGGGAADKGQRAKGIPWKMAVAVLVAALIGMYWIVEGVGAAGWKWFRGSGVIASAKPAVAVRQPASEAFVGSVVSNAPARVGGGSVGPSVAQPGAGYVVQTAVPTGTNSDRIPDLEVTGWASTDGGAVVQLADGSRLYGTNLQVGRFIIMDGQRYVRAKREAPGKVGR